MTSKPPKTPEQQVDMALLVFIAEICKRLLQTRALDANSIQTTLLVLRDEANSTQNPVTAKTFDLLRDAIFGSASPPPSAEILKLRD